MDHNLRNEKLHSAHKILFIVAGTFWNKHLLPIEMCTISYIPNISAAHLQRDKLWGPLTLCNTTSPGFPNVSHYQEITKKHQCLLRCDAVWFGTLCCLTIPIFIYLNDGSNMIPRNVGTVRTIRHHTTQHNI